MFDKIENELFKDGESWCSSTLKSITDFTVQNQIMGSVAVVGLTQRIDTLDCAIRNRIQRTTDIHYINTKMKEHFLAHPENKPSDADIEFHAYFLKEKLLAKYLETLSTLHTLKHYKASTSIDVIHKYKKHVATKYEALRDSFVLSTEEVEHRCKQMSGYVTLQLRSLKTNFNKELVQNASVTKWSALSAGVPSTVSGLVTLANTSTAPVEQTYSQIKTTIEQNAAAFSLTRTPCTASFYNNEKQRLTQLGERESKLKTMLTEYSDLLKSNQTNILLPVTQYKPMQTAEVDKLPAMKVMG